MNGEVLAMSATVLAAVVSGTLNLAVTSRDGSSAACRVMPVRVERPLCVPAGRVSVTLPGCGFLSSWMP
jgi:hypothetical protein